MTRKRPQREDLSGLLGKSAELLQPQTSPSSMPVTQLRPAPNQPRRTFDDAGLQELARSIREQGVLQPLLVRPVEGGHEIVAGERRWRAAQLAELSEVPVIVRTLDDRQARVAALVENLQRENLNVIDEVDAKLSLAALALNLSPEDAAVRLRRLLHEEPGPEHEVLTALFAPLGEAWEGFTKNKLRLLNWPAPLLDALRAGLPFTLASVIAGAPEEHQARLTLLALNGTSRAELRSEVERLGKADQRGESSRAVEAVRRLTSRRFMARLAPEDKKAVERWLAKMPSVLRAGGDAD